MTKALRQGVQLGTASDADLRFITSMGASEMQDDSTREAIVTNLLGQEHRNMKYGTEVSKLLAKGMNIGDAMDEAQKRVPEVTPTLPPELEKAPRGDPAWRPGSAGTSRPIRSGERRTARATSCTLLAGRHHNEREHGGRNPGPARFLFNAGGANRGSGGGLRSTRQQRPDESPDIPVEDRVSERRAKAVA